MKKKTSDQKTVVLIDDHPIYRSGLKSVVESNGAFKVLGEADNARKGLAIVKKKEPDIAIVDLSLPDRNGIILTQDILALTCKTRVMVVSAHSKINYVIKSIQAGALGYIIKESGAEAIIKCLECVSQGKKYIDHSLSEKLCEWFVFMNEPVTEELTGADKYGELSKREQEIFRLIAEGFDLNEISDKLCVSYKTVTTHRTSIMRKLGLSTPKEIVQYATDVGIVDLDQLPDGHLHSKL